MDDRLDAARIRVLEEVAQKLPWAASADADVHKAA
jgi:hypothetical protein